MELFLFLTAETIGGLIFVRSFWNDCLDDAEWILSLKPHEQYNKFRQLKYLLWKGLEMAAKERKNATNNSRGSDSTEFLNVYLSEDDETGLSSIENADNGDLLGELLRVVSLGANFQIKQGNNADFCAMFFWTYGTGKNVRHLGVSAFSDAPRDAIVGLLYKFVYRLHDGTILPDSNATTKRRFR